MTGLVIVVTGMHEVSGVGGVEMTSKAFGAGISWFPYILTASVILFAFSTMLSWSYYGQQAWSFIFGESAKMELVYKVLFCFFVVIGSAASLGAVLDFSDGMFFFMCLFNLAGVWMLYPVVREELEAYKKHVKSVEGK
jgi:AGCS family alanine or glycine:cation symporter